MGSKRKDLEIIYNIQWKNKPANGGDKANIIGMYDIPATTLNWEIFKSYLLKNSGTVGDDLKVSYITDSNREFPIESQTDFQVALYAFRRKARMGDIVNLKLDRMSNQSTHKNIRHSNDVETQFDNNEAVSLTSTCCSPDVPPDWFVSYMSQFKKNITEDLISTVSNLVSNIKPPTISQPSSYHHVRKSKAECTKRIRKHPPHGESSYETKDLIKSLKLEGKLERKLEKLEHKTKKIKEKKLALFTKSSDSDAGPSVSRSRPNPHCEKDDSFEMDATPIDTLATPTHMLGGEVYLHHWDVMNTGKHPWTSKTTLNFTWGSKALKPLDTIISVPFLKPGDTGRLAVRLQIPKQPGEYECYWHFHHKDRRFGHWLGCQVTVDPFDLKGNKSVLETSFMAAYDPTKFKANDDVYNIDEAVTQYTELVPDPVTSTTSNCPYNTEENRLRDVHAKMQRLNDMFARTVSCTDKDVKLQDATDTNCSSDSDNQSIVSASESNSSKEFVVVPIPDCFKVDQTLNASQENIPSASSDKESKDLVPDSVAKQSSAEAIPQLAEEATEGPENYDDNNNTEETNQNSAVGKNIGEADGDTNSSSSHGSRNFDMVVISLPKEKDEEETGYAYVVVDGHKVPIPKKILKPEYLKAIVEAPSTTKTNLTRSNSSHSSAEFVNAESHINPEETDLQKDSAEPQINGLEGQDPNVCPDSNDFVSHCSAAGSSFSEVNADAENNARLFIFPHNCPGYEVVYPVLDMPHSEVTQGEYKWTESDTQYAFASSTPVTTYPELPVPSAPEQTTPANTTTTNSPPLNLSTHDRNPFSFANTVHVPNYQQTHRSTRASSLATEETTVTEIHVNIPATQAAAPNSTNTPPSAERSAQSVHILPETLVSGAVNVASSAMNTARSVLNMIVPQPMPMPTNNNVLQQPGRWVNGHWISTNPETPREANLQALAEMGFWNRDLNATLLARYNDDLSRVVAELVQ